MLITDYRGDSATYQFTIRDTDISGWKIECEIWDDIDNDIKKSTANVVGEVIHKF